MNLRRFIVPTAVYAALMLTMTALATAPSVPSRQLIVNGGFEDGLSGWQCTGAVALDSRAPITGKASLRVGPGVGSVSQRIPVSPDNHLSISAVLRAEPAGTGKLIVRFLDSNGNELMRISNADMKLKEGKLTDYFKPHPLTASVEVIVSKDSASGFVSTDEVELTLWEDNDPQLRSKQNISELMRPFWKGDNVSGEAVLMQTANGRPGTGTLMFRPTRIVSVTSYDGAVQYREGNDYTVEGRTVVAPPGSRMTTVLGSDLLQGELAWNITGGKQVLVTYEHNDAWSGPVQAYVGDELSNTIRKLRAHEPLTIVAYGDSITFGIGSSQMRKIAPYQVPWIDLFTAELKKDYTDPQVTLYNASQSGAASDWARSMAGRMVASLGPDLVVIAFGQNDFWRIDADTFGRNILSVIDTVRATNPRAEFLLVSTMRFDPTYSTKRAYWDLVTQYQSRLRSLTGPGVQMVDMTAISEAVFAAKAPKDSLNDPLHPDDYLMRWYAQSMIAALVPDTGLHAQPKSSSSAALSFSTPEKGIGDIPLRR
jgi:lysophospholipase L1-like esterase